MVGGLWFLQEKLKKDATKFIGKVGHDSEHYNILKKHIQESNAMQQDINHVLEWTEMPDNTPITVDKLNRLLFKVGSKSEEFNTSIELARGYVKAQNK